MRQLHTPEQAAQWLRDQVGAHGNLTTDSRQVTAGDAFIAWPGAALDGRQYIAKAIAQGAKACLMEQAGSEDFSWSALTEGERARLAVYPQLKVDSGLIASEFYGHPSQDIEVLAITGTNGKTSSAWWLAHALEHLNQPSAVAGTLGVGRVGHLQMTGLTTPDPIDLQRRLRQLADDKVLVCALEASSIGIAEHRLAGTHLRLAMFTNFTQDHLDYHGSMQAYWQAKQALFDWPQLQGVIVNVDDDKGRELVQSLRGNESRVWTIGREANQQPRHISASHVHYTTQGLSFDVCELDQSYPLVTSFVGEYNISNLLGVIAALRELGVDLASAVRACHDLPAVPGRMQAVSQSPLVLVDYAHTPDALHQALRALVALTQQRQGQLVCVIGCGGNRDSGKRPLMTAAAQQWAQRVIVTSDNPRDESAQSIIEQMLADARATPAPEVEIHRERAIERAIVQANPNDVILIAGKGHEQYQEIAGVRHPFSDVTQAQKAISARRAHD
jgi:UDP-N-acetylmuramoyl-L-alanyl-D-glutamate--2,6-diaminopimelate ligase